MHILQVTVINDKWLDLWMHLVLQVTVLGRGCAIGRALSCTTCSCRLSEVPASLQLLQSGLPCRSLRRARSHESKARRTSNHQSSPRRERRYNLNLAPHYWNVSPMKRTTGETRCHTVERLRSRTQELLTMCR